MGKDLTITTVVAAALLSGACTRKDDSWKTTDRDTAICTDQNGQRVPDTNCTRQAGYHGGGMGSAFLWYYLGRNSVMPYYGERVTGGSFTRTAGATYFHAPAASAVSRSASVSRGGFGASARGFGGVGE